jgi:hypothetical protein
MGKKEEEEFLAIRSRCPPPATRRPSWEGGLHSIISNVLNSDTTLLTLLRCQYNGKSSLSKTSEDRKDSFHGLVSRGWVSRRSNRLKTTSLIYKGLNNPRTHHQPTLYINPVWDCKKWIDNLLGKVLWFSWVWVSCRSKVSPFRLWPSYVIRLMKTLLYEV